MNYSQKTQKNILLLSWAAAVLFFFVGALTISEQRKTPPPNTNLVIDNETYYSEIDIPESSIPETQFPVQTTIPTGSVPKESFGETSSSPETEETIPNSTDVPSTTQPPAVIVPPSPPPKFDPPDYSGFDAVLKESADAGQSYIDKMVFLGDSRTYGLGYYNAVSRKQIWTPANGTLTLSLVNSVLIVYPETNESLSVKDAVAKKKPEILVVSLGINGISFMNEKAFKGTFDVLISTIKSVSPDTKIILQAMYPTSPSYRNWYSINNTKILKGNQWMLETAQSNGVYFLDAYGILADENGNMSAEYHNGDWLHPNGAGYQKIIQYIRTHPIPTPPTPVPDIQEPPAVTTESNVTNSPHDSSENDYVETTDETTGTI